MKQTPYYRPNSYQAEIIAKWKVVRQEYERHGYQLIETPAKYYISPDGESALLSEEHWNNIVAIILNPTEELIESENNILLETVVEYAILRGIDPFFYTPWGEFKVELIPEWVFKHFDVPIPPEEGRELYKYFVVFCEEIMPIKFPSNKAQNTQLFIKELKEITEPLPNDKREERKRQNEMTRIYLTFMKVRTLLKDIEYHHKSKYRKEDSEQLNESIYPLYCGEILFTLSLKKDKITFEIENVRSVTATVPNYTTTANGYPINQWSNKK